MTHILVVDDSELDRRLAGKLLERNGRFHVEFASNGVEAIEHLEERTPLAVVTDLLMPEMDGLALVEQVHRRFANIPVVVITAHGSEEVALKALLAGAADFVPKIRLAADLQRAVESVISFGGGGSHERIAPYLKHYEVRYELATDLSLIPPLIADLQDAALEMGIVDKSDRVRLVKAIGAALENAILHGNLELTTAELMTAETRQNDVVSERRNSPPYCDRHVFVSALLTPTEARISIRDEGPGFDVAGLSGSRSTPEQLISGERRGLVLIRAFLDDVQFNQAGNEITLIKRKQAV
jgi:CheY-like chemotaxis protein/anti-sigma regulatory factor (Ser/Thr protein kinase)